MTSVVMAVKYIANDGASSMVCCWISSVSVLMSSGTPARKASILRGGLQSSEPTLLDFLGGTVLEEIG